jgi:hypothetical protein
MLKETIGERFTMLNNLGNFISSFGSNSRKNVSSVLRDSKLEKQELGRMINKLSSFVSAGDYIPVYVSLLSEMQRAPIIDFFRDMELKVKTLYNISSTLSVLSSSMENIFGGEIKKIENDLAYLNSYIDNYSFLSRRRRFI